MITKRQTSDYDLLRPLILSGCENIMSSCFGGKIIQTGGRLLKDLCPIPHQGVLTGHPVSLGTAHKATSCGARCGGGAKILRETGEGKPDSVWAYLNILAVGLPEVQCLGRESLRALWASLRVQLSKLDRVDDSGKKGGARVSWLT